MTTSEPIGRAQSEQSVSTPQHRFPTSDGAMRIGQFVAHDPSGIIGGLTKTLLAIWPKGTTPKNKDVAKNRQRIMWGGTLNPIDTLYRMSCAAVDEGRDGLQWARDLIAQVEQYKVRHERPSSGVLPFSQVHVRLVTRSIREDCEADVATAGVDLDDIASLEQARKERLEAIGQDERLVECYTHRIAELRAGR